MKIAMKYTSFFNKWLSLLFLFLAFNKKLVVEHYEILETAGVWMGYGKS